MSTRKIKVKDIQVGDKIDLESCPHLKTHTMAEFEFGRVCEIEHEPDCIVLHFENIGDPSACGYSPEAELMVEREGEKVIDLRARLTETKLFSRLLWQELFNFYREQGCSLTEMDSLLCDLYVFEQRFHNPFTLWWCCSPGSGYTEIRDYTLADPDEGEVVAENEVRVTFDWEVPHILLFNPKLIDGTSVEHE